MKWNDVWFNETPNTKKRGRVGHDKDMSSFFKIF